MVKQQSAKPITTSMVARELGLSRATVSYVLNGQARQNKISDETIARVEAMVRKLNYVPNELARSLRLQHSGVIGLVTRGLGYNWVESILVGLLPVFDAAEYTPFLSTNYWDAKREDRELTMLLQRRVDAIICIPMPYNEARYREIIERGIPLIFLGDVLAGMEDASYVVWDTYRATRTAVRHLIETGRRRIGFIGANHQTLWTQARYQAWAATLEEAGLEIHPQWVAWELFDFSYQVKQKIERMVDKVFDSGHKPPDALYVSTDALAMQILDILARRGLRVPEDVALIGLGDMFMADHAGISLSTVKEPTLELGRQVAEVALELIRHPDHGPLQRTLVSEELVARNSTAVAGTRVAS